MMLGSVAITFSSFSTEMVFVPEADSSRADSSMLKTSILSFGSGSSSPGAREVSLNVPMYPSAARRSLVSGSIAGCSAGCAASADASSARSCAAMRSASARLSS